MMKRNTTGALHSLALLGATALTMVPVAAWAQAASALQPTDAGAQPQTTNSLEEIVVTARKRQESVLNVPVVATVVSGETLQQQQVTSIADLQKLVPGLNMGTATLSIGTIVSLRGIGTSSQDSGVDQSVSVNIDGLAFSQGLAITSGMFDVQGVEVLKGPQALFYGKASPGGVISLRTADPTNAVQVIGRAAYEFEADEARGELIVSGPVSDTLRLRLAAMSATSEGYFRNTAIPLAGSGAAAPPSRAGGAENLIVRGTALWSPSDRLDARIKLNYTRDDTTMPGGQQFVSCPDGLNEAPSGIPFLQDENCVLDGSIRQVAIDPTNFPGIPNGGVPFAAAEQMFGTFEGTFHITPSLDLTSTTGFYRVDSESLGNTFTTSHAGTTLAISNDFERRDFTQEFRLDSDFSSRINFTLGAFYQDASQTNRVNVRGNTAYPFTASTRADGRVAMEIETYSAFGQGRWQVTPEIELAAGARWTDESRSEVVTDLRTGLIRPVLTPAISSSNIAPEATVTYRPTDNLTLFAAYKKGFKSGSFSMSTIPAAGSDNSFGDESVEGGELGLKTRLFDRTMNLNLATYHYDYTGLQVGASLMPEGGLPVIRTVNAGAARAYGVELDAVFRPAGVPGLGLNAALNWNHTRYTDFTNAPCYSGQMTSEGCNQVRNPLTGLFTSQDLTGVALVRSPDWQANFGFEYEVGLPGGQRLTFNQSNKYSSSYYTSSGVNRPNDDNVQNGFIKSDFGVTLSAADDRWQLALIGNNLTDEIVSGNCGIFNAANGSVLGGHVTGGDVRGVAGRSEVTCWTERGRSVWLKFTYRPSY